MISYAALEPGDRERLASLFDRLSPETLYRRFLSPIQRLEQVPVARLLDLDHHDREAIAALDGGDLVGVARYARRPDSDVADLAVVVADGWHGQGVGTRLLAALADRATEEGVRWFALSMQADNRRAIALVKHFAPEVRFLLSHGVYEALVPVKGEVPCVTTG